MRDLGHVALGSWSGGRFMHFGEPLPDDRLDVVLRPGADIDELALDPCIPAHGERFELTRPYRGSQLHITVENPHGKTQGIKNLVIDGQKVPGNRVPPSEKPHIEISAVLE